MHDLQDDCLRAWAKLLDAGAEVPTWITDTACLAPESEAEAC